MTPLIVLSVIAFYFVVLMFISYRTSRNSGENAFFDGDRKSPWFLVAFGMVGAVISGVTFVSIPGLVGNDAFHYFQFVMGNVVGYLFIAFVLVPLYYKLKLVSIYSFLDSRFGDTTYKTGSLFFILSQSFGAALRLLLAVKILQYAFFDAFQIPIYVTTVILLLLIWLYTHQSGIKTIVWTDALQTFFLLSAAVIAIFTIKSALQLTSPGLLSTITTHDYFIIFEWDSLAGSNFFKQFISGALIAIAMMGLDQNMMQKTLTCKNVNEAKKNVLTFSLFLALAQFLFLCLGVLLYVYAEANGIALAMDGGSFLDTDKLFPMLSLEHFGLLAGIAFLLGIVAASFSSADSALTALTTSFCYDFLRIDQKPKARRKPIKNIVLFGFNVLLFVIVMSFAGSKGAIISLIFKVAGYTYGPLLGLYLLGMFSRIQLRDKWVPVVCITAALSTYILNEVAINAFNFDFGFMNIFVNALLTVLGLFFIKAKREVAESLS
ncbi:sodium:solute symporter [Arenibacter sp. GZD96]|uniref:sodium:solute symporter n=1 Tax=Aurantibrevibacter litoralis TaxID=3106030 RepID=UPI002AFFE5DE|nr:sodium:solute symporter [Arenibacter sp. GZD-96]MEA1786236.1 sodium:solute symporter [Arenibacter sp. GZD-96]